MTRHVPLRGRKQTVPYLAERVGEGKDFGWGHVHSHGGAEQNVECQSLGFKHPLQGDCGWVGVGVRVGVGGEVRWGRVAGR